MNVIEVKFSDVRDIIDRAFPGARSRRSVKIESRSAYTVADYWDGGSRAECRFLELGSFRVMSSSEIPDDVRQKAGNPYNLPVCSITLTPGYCVVEHSIFCGKDMGYRIYVSPERFRSLQSDNVVKALTSTVSDKLLVG